MIPVSNYVDTSVEGFSGKSDFELWHMLDETTRMLVALEYLGDRIEGAVVKLGEKVGGAVLSMKGEQL